MVRGMQVTEIDSLKIIYEKGENDIMFVRPEGFLDTYNSHDFLLDVITKTLRKDFCKIIFDCTALTFISSTGIGTFIEILKDAKERKGGIAFYNLSSKIHDVFQLLGFTQLFLIGKTKEEAIGKLEGKIKTPAFKDAECPVCKKLIMVKSPGRFRCSQCKSILNIGEDLTISVP